MSGRFGLIGQAVDKFLSVVLLPKGALANQCCNLKAWRTVTYIIFYLGSVSLFDHGRLLFKLNHRDQLLGIHQPNFRRSPNEGWFLRARLPSLLLALGISSRRTRSTNS